MKFFIIIKQHSERVKDKNFRLVGGIPLWKHLVNELTGQDVYIDTDSDKILDECQNIEHVTAYAREQGHINLELDASFKVSPALLMIERFLDERVEDENEVIITPHVTSPYIKLKTIMDASLYLNQGYDSVQACTSHQEFAYYQGAPINFDQTVIQKTQDLEPILLGNGAFFIFKKGTFKECKNRTGKNPYFYPIPFPESIEIDTHEDLEIAKKWSRIL
tara:strand:- start:5261 stop:5917 length:657 start_codon:yes stop_codon:yes gene_type:complete